MSDLSVRLGRLQLPNPVVVAAGTFGYGEEFAEAVDLRQLGAIVTKTITLQPRAGNPPPRLVPTPSGMLNSVGLQNVGVEEFLAKKLPGLRRWGVPVIVSILGESPEELARLAQRVGAAEGVAAIEANLSCPNLRRPAATGGTRHPIVAHDPAATAEMIRAARAATRLPLIAKLSPDTSELVAVARAAVEAGAEILTLVNTFTGMALDIRTRSSKLGSLTGGLSGPAIRPIAVRCVWEVSRALQVPVIGVGGIVTADDAIEFLLAGASAVGVGSAHFANPCAAQQVVEGLRRYAAEHRLTAIRELIGAANVATA